MAHKKIYVGLYVHDNTIDASIADRLADVYRPAYITTLGMGVCTVGLFMAAAIKADTSLPLIIVIASLAGSSLGLFASSNMTAIMGSAASPHNGDASSMVAFMYSSGRLVSEPIIAVFL